MNLNRLSILCVLLLLNGCAYTSLPQYPSISGTVKSGGKPVPSMKIKLVEDTWDSDTQNCKGKSRTEKTNRDGYFKFKQKNNSVFITPFNFESASDKMMEDNDLMVCIFQNDSYIPVLELDSHDMGMAMIHGVKIECDLREAENVCKSIKENNWPF